MSKSQTTLINRLCLLEMWERFGYYGMRALLTLFIIKQLGFSEGKAYLIYGLYAAICYIVPVIGGILADRLLGYKNLLFSGSVIMCVGHYILTFLSANETLFYIGIAAVSVGTGFFKGNISNMLGSIYGGHNSKDRDNAFRKFYIAINFGSFIASVLCGFVANIYGWNYAFGCAGLGMLIGLVTLIASKNILKNYGNIPQDSKVRYKGRLYQNSISYLLGIALITVTSIMFLYYEESIKVISVIGVIIILHVLYTASKYDKKSQKGIILLFMMLVFFMIMFALEMQLGSFINVFTDKHVDKEILGFVVPTASLQALNPLTIIILGSGLSYLLRNTPAKYSLMVFGAGLLMAGMCFVILYLGCNFYNESYEVNISFLIIAMIFMAISEIMMAPIMQSAVTYITPVKIRGYMMGFVMLSLSYSNIIGSVVLKHMLHLDKDNVNSLTSLISYQGCFLNIAIIFLVTTIVYVALYKFMAKIYLSFD